MVFDDEFSIAPFMREFTIPPNWTDIVQHRSQSVAPDNIGLKDTWFTSYIEEYPRKTPSHKPRVSPKNNRNTFTSSQYILHVQESPSMQGVSVSEVTKHPAYEVV